MNCKVNYLTMHRDSYCYLMKYDPPIPELTKLNHSDGRKSNPLIMINYVPVTANTTLHTLVTTLLGNAMLTIVCKVISPWDFLGNLAAQKYGFKKRQI